MRFPSLFQNGYLLQAIESAGRLAYKKKEEENNEKEVIVSILVGAMSVSVLAGCGGSDKAETTTSAPAQTTATEEEVQQTFSG